MSGPLNVAILCGTLPRIDADTGERTGQGSGISASLASVADKKGAHQEWCPLSSRLLDWSSSARR